MELEIIPPDLTKYQSAILDSEARFTVTAAATKCGKTFSHLWWIFREALKGKEGNNFWWVAPVYSQAEIAFKRLKAKTVNVKGFRINESKLTIITPNGAVIHFKSAEKPDNLYGEDVYAAVFDEFTRARAEAWTALRSTLTATKGKCKFIGNVKGRNNWGYKLAQRAKNGEPGYQFHKITAYDAVDAGILDLSEVEQARRDLSEKVFNELYLAEPSEDGSNPFGFEHIRKCLAPIGAGQPLYFGVDLAKRKDWTVIIGLDANGKVCHFQRFQMSWDETKKEVIKAIGKSNAIIDSTGVGDPIVEEVVKYCRNAQGLNYASGHRMKQQLMEGLAAAIQGGEVSYPEGIISDELQAFEFEYTTTGGVKYSAPEGFTDDAVNALALAVRCKQSKPIFKAFKTFTA